MKDASFLSMAGRDNFNYSEAFLLTRFLYLVPGKVNPETIRLEGKHGYLSLSSLRPGGSITLRKLFNSDAGGLVYLCSALVEIH